MKTENGWIKRRQDTEARRIHDRHTDENLEREQERADVAEDKRLFRSCRSAVYEQI